MCVKKPQFDFDEEYKSVEHKFSVKKQNARSNKPRDFYETPKGKEHQRNYDKKTPAKPTPGKPAAKPKIAVTATATPQPGEEADDGQK